MGGNSLPPALLSLYWTWHIIEIQPLPRCLQPDDTEREGLILLMEVLRWFHGTVGEDEAFACLSV